MEINENQWTKKINIFKNSRAEKHPETTHNTWKTHFRPSEPSLNIIQDTPKSVFLIVILTNPGSLSLATLHT